MAAGLISPDEFVWMSELFLEQSNKVNDSWAIVKASDGKKYLAKKMVIATSERNQGKCNMQDKKDFMSFEEEDPSSLNSEELELSIPVVCEYHIVYSSSYSVPVLYFNMHTKDGKLLSLEDVWKLVPEYYRERLEHERWTFITQQEHPVLHRPFYQLHPCHTADLMESVPPCPDRSKYLITWLSAVGPVIGLNLPLSYGLSEAIHPTGKKTAEK